MPSGPDPPPPPQSLTPSEILLLRCDLFAPVPPLTTSDRIAFEWNNAAGYLIAMFFAAGFFSAATQISEDHASVVRIVTALIFLGLPALWWFNRRSANPHLEREGLDIAFPLSGAVPVVLHDYVRQSISAALLAGDQRGTLTLTMEGTHLDAHFHESATPWPQDSLEDRLRRSRPITVEDLVHDWMADGSNFPWRRASRLIEHSAILRGVLSTQLTPNAAVVPEGEVAKVKGLLDLCQNQRPAIWKALQTSIDAALKSRTVPPTTKQVGRMTVPEYNYPEAPISSLDAPRAAPAEDGNTSTSNVPERKPASTESLLVWSLVFLAADAVTLFVFHHQENTLASALTALGALAAAPIVGLLSERKAMRRKRLCESYNLPSESSQPQTWQRKLASALAVSAMAALPVTIKGPWAAIVPLVFFGIAIGMAQSSRFGAQLSAEIVAARVRALAANEPPAIPTAIEAPAEAAPSEPQSPFITPLIPDQPTAAHDLPHPAGEIAEQLSRWTTRRARFRRLHWLSLGLLAGGYTLLTLGFMSLGDTPWLDHANGFLGPVPFGLLFTLAATGMAVYGLRNSDAVEDEQGDSRHSVPSFLIAAWRVNILVQAPLLFSVGISVGAGAAMHRHPYFVVSAFLFLVLHWFWMEQAKSRIMRDLPVPVPRRLIMLRVFGSPSFDDLVTLIGPWRRIGIIEHLEGFDTIGQRSDVQTAVGEGQVDRILAKNWAEVEEQLKQAGTGTDRALLFKRHAFQCTNATWREAIQAMLDRGDAVLMDLSSLSVQNQGCAWELGQLLDRVPLEKVTLLVNDSTDLDCLRSILENAARHIAPHSPNRDNPGAIWQQIRIGGLSQRQAGEDYYTWKRRIDDRLDPMLLTSHLLSATHPANPPSAAAGSAILSAPWASQPWWPWLALMSLSALLSVRLWRSP